MDRHKELIVEQFTRQALPFASSPAINSAETLKQLVDLSGAGPLDTVLDVACGPGLVVCAFAEVVHHATGIDLTPAMIDAGRDLQASKQLANVSWETGDVEHLPFPDESFSIVTSRYAFHHLLDPARVLAEMTRVCGSGGTVVLSDVVASPDPEKAARFDQMERLRDPSHVRVLRLDEMRILFDSAGLTEPRECFYRLETELERALSISFPNKGDADKVRRLVIDSIENNAMGTDTYRDGDRIKYFYPIATLVARKP